MVRLVDIQRHIHLQYTLTNIRTETTYCASVMKYALARGAVLEGRWILYTGFRIGYAQDNE